MGLSNHKKVKVRNPSKYPMIFSWKLYDGQNEKSNVSKMLTLIDEMKKYEAPRCKKLEYYDILDVKQHKVVLERICQDEKEDLLGQKEKLLYQNKFFQIIPLVSS